MDDWSFASVAELPPLGLCPLKTNRSRIARNAHPVVGLARISGFEVRAVTFQYVASRTTSKDLRSLVCILTKS